MYKVHQVKLDPQSGQIEGQFYTKKVARFPGSILVTGIGTGTFAQNNQATGEIVTDIDFMVQIAIWPEGSEPEFFSAYRDLELHLPADGEAYIWVRYQAQAGAYVEIVSIDKRR